MDKELSKNAENASSANLTAVEWLIEQMFKQGYFDGNKPLSYTNLEHLQNQAKEMEKEQIIEARNDGFAISAEGWNGEYGIIDFNCVTQEIHSEEYYNETYGGKNA